MSAIIKLFCWVGLNIFVGVNMLALLDRKNLLTATEKFAVSFLLGLGAISLEMFIVGSLGFKFITISILGPWLILFSYNMIASRAYFSNLLKSRKPYLSRFEKMIFTFISVEFIYTFLRAVLKPIEAHDSVAIYGLKAKILYLANTVPPDFFVSLSRNFHGAHPDYPLLVPMAETWFYIFFNEFNEFLVKSIFPLAFLAFIAAFYFILKRVSGSKLQALLFTFILSSIAQFNNYGTIGVADMFMSINFSLALLYLYLWINNTDEPLYMILSLLFSLLCIWTKNEGTLLVFINILVLLSFTVRKYSSLKKSSLMFSFLYTAVLAGSVIIWAGYKIKLGLVNENFNPGMINIHGLKGSLNNIPVVLYEYQKQIFGFKKWNMIWILFIGLFILRFKKAFKNNIIYITLAALFFFAGYSLAYLFSAVEINFFLKKTASRFLLHILPVCVFWIHCMTKSDIFGNDCKI